MNKPLADTLRPTKFEDIVGQKHLLGEESLFLKAINGAQIPNMIFYGPPGTGKTTVANIIANSSNLTLHKLNGTTASIDDIKKIIEQSDTLFAGKGILLYLDEIQYLNKKQQQSLLEYVESGAITLIASTTENPYFYVYNALLSRCLVFEFKSIPVEEIKKGIIKAFNKFDYQIDDDALTLLASINNGDMRKALNNVEFLISAKKDDKHITKKDISLLAEHANIAYDRSEDKHYDNLSAFMKSLRGSDPDAAIFYLAKLIEGGDIIAASRRLLCSVTEDVGLAYPTLIPIVKSCIDSAMQLGLPEARLPLANATILIATAPKSNAACLAIDAALGDVKKGKGINVPRQLQNNHYDGADALSRGQNYLYPHDYPNHYVDFNYLPDDLKSAKYYVPQDNKFEQSLKQYWDKIKK